MTILIIALAAALSGSSEASTAPAPTPAAPPSSAHAEKPADDPDRVICKSEEVTGNRFMRKVCMTRAQWAARQAAADRFMRETDSRSGIPADIPAGPS